MPDIAKKIKINQQKIEITERFDFLVSLAADPRLTGTNAVAVAVYLIKCRNGQTGLINPGYSKIAKGAGCSVSAAKTAVNKLEETGWFIVIGKKNSSGTNFSNTYIPNWDQARGGVANALGVVSQTDEGGPQADEVVSQTDEGRVAGRRRVVRLLAANSVNKNSVKELSEPTQETQDAYGVLPADLSDRREEDNYDESDYDVGGKYYLPGSKWFEADRNPFGDINLHNEYSEIFAKWSGYSQPENLGRYKELRRSGVEQHWIECAASLARGVSLREFLAGRWKDFDDQSGAADNDNQLPVRKVSGYDIDLDDDEPF